MVDVGVALAWVAISGVSLKWLSAFDRAPVDSDGRPDLPLPDGAFLQEDLHPLDRAPVHIGGVP